MRGWLNRGRRGKSTTQRCNPNSQFQRAHPFLIISSIPILTSASLFPRNPAILSFFVSDDSIDRSKCLMRIGTMPSCIKNSQLSRVYPISQSQQKLSCSSFQHCIYCCDHPAGSSTNALKILHATCQNPFRPDQQCKIHLCSSAKLENLSWTAPSSGASQQCIHLSEPPPLRLHSSPAVALHSVHPPAVPVSSHVQGSFPTNNPGKERLAGAINMKMCFLAWLCTLSIIV